MNRRFFLKSGGVALASLGAGVAVPSFLERAVMAQAPKAAGGRRKTLVAIFQRGAVDGLNMVGPHGESNYYEWRPSIAVARPGRGSAGESAVDLYGLFSVRAGQQSQVVQGGFEDIYEQAATEALRGTGKETFEAINFLKRVNPAQYQPENGAQYPRTQFGNSLLQIAQLIKAGVGLEVAFTDIQGWDTHTNQGGGRGQLANRLTEFGAGLLALYTDLGAPRMDDVVVLTMSEFGRTARENGNRGTDHGHANAMFIIGGATRGGRVYGQWPGLHSDKIYERGDPPPPP